MTHGGHSLPTMYRPGIQPPSRPGATQMDRQTRYERLSRTDAHRLPGSCRCRHMQTRWPGPNLAAKLQGQSGPLHRVDTPFVSFKLHFLNFYNPRTLTRATHVLTEAAKVRLAEHTMPLSPRAGPSPTAGLTAPAHLWASLPPPTRTLCLRHTTHLHSTSLMVG